MSTHEPTIRVLDKTPRSQVHSNLENQHELTIQVLDKMPSPQVHSNLEKQYIHKLSLGTSSSTTYSFMFVIKLNVQLISIIQSI